MSTSPSKKARTEKKQPSNKGRHHDAETKHCKLVLDDKCLAAEGPTMNVIKALLRALGPCRALEMVCSTRDCVENPAHKGRGPVATPYQKAPFYVADKLPCTRFGVGVDVTTTENKKAPLDKQQLEDACSVACWIKQTTGVQVQYQHDLGLKNPRLRVFFYHKGTDGFSRTSAGLDGGKGQAPFDEDGCVPFDEAGVHAVASLLMRVHTAAHRDPLYILGWDNGLWGLPADQVFILTKWMQALPFVVKDKDARETCEALWPPGAAASKPDRQTMDTADV